MKQAILLIAIVLSFTCAAHAACVNGFYNGLPCASTTRYYDGYMGACGCGPQGSNSAFSWNMNEYTGAGSQIFFNPGNDDVSWCGTGCGACYRLTPTGDCPYPGNCAVNRNPITVMITNLCPFNGNEQWCPRSGATNNFGYKAHIDLHDKDMNGLITALGWNNPIVTYERVPCSSGSSLTPTCAQASQCMCSSVMTQTCAAGSAPSTPRPTPRPTPKPTTRPTPSATVKPTPRPTPSPPKPTSPFITKQSVTPTSGRPGDTFVVKFRVTAGASALTGANTGFHIYSVNDVADTNAIVNGFKYSFNLAAYQSIDLTFNAKIPTSTPKGQYKVTHGLWNSAWALLNNQWIEPAAIITLN